MPDSGKYGLGDDIPGMSAAPAEPTSQPVQPRRSRLWATVRAVLRARVTAGLILVLPIWITYLVVKFLFDLMRDTSLWVVVSYLQSDWGEPIRERWGVSSAQLESQGLEALRPEWQWAIAIVAVFLTVIFLYIIGVLSANIFGRRLLAAAESLVERVPLVKTIYMACKQILETFAGESAKKFQRVCLVPIPSAEIRSVGFLTGTTRDAQTGEELCTVFLVISPHPTAGYVFILKRSEVVELDWTMEDAMRLMVSCGVIVPPSMPFSVPTRAASPAKPGRPVPVP